MPPQRATIQKTHPLKQTWAKTSYNNLGNSTKEKKSHEQSNKKPQTEKGRKAQFKFRETSQAVSDTVERELSQTSQKLWPNRDQQFNSSTTQSYSKMEQATDLPSSNQFLLIKPQD